MSNTDSNYISALLEEIREQNKAMLKAVGDMQTNVAKIPPIDQGLTELRQDTKSVNAAVTDMGKQQNNHEDRISRLETA